MSTPPLTAVEQTQLDSFEAAAYAEESLRERIARAMAAVPRGGRDDWPLLSDAGRDLYRRTADAALAVIRTPVDLS